jgi:hypothetical protein
MGAGFPGMRAHATGFAGGFKDISALADSFKQRRNVVIGY